MKSRLLFSCLIALTTSTTIQAAASPKRLGLASSHLRAPLRFEPNRGQMDSRVKFDALGAGYGIYLTSSDIVLAVHRASKTSAVRLSFEGSRSATLSAEGMLASHTNYLIGSDPRGWHADIPNFSSVRYSQLYPGIDLVLYGRQRRLEYDFVVTAGASLKSLVLRVDGASSILATRAGDLLLRTDSGELIQHRPIAYQHGRNGRERVDAWYEPRPGHRVSIRVGKYDRRRELIIDPALSYSTYFGGANDQFNNTEGGESVAVDASGHAYVTGCTTANDYPLKNPQQSAFSGSTQAFVSKFAANGSGLVYSTFIGGSSGDSCGGGIAVDRSNQAYIVGSTTSGSFGTVIGPAEGADVFAAKLNASGDALLYAVRFGGSNSASIGGVALDSGGHLYMTGSTFSSDFPTTAGVFMPTRGSGSDESAWVAKLNSSGTGFIYSTYLSGGGVQAEGHSIAIDSGLNAYIAGDAGGPGFPTTARAFQPTFPAKNISGVGSAFVTKLNPSGSALAYSTYLGGNNVDHGYGIAVDSSGRAYVTGSTGSTNFPTTSGAFQRSNHGNTDLFVTRLNASGSGLSYSTLVGGSNADVGYSIAVNSSGQAHVAGYTQSALFPVKNAIQKTLHGGADAFALKLWANGAGLHYSTYLGGAGDDVGRALRLDGNGNAYVAGNTRSSNFPVTSGAYHRTKRGVTDGFLSKISP